MPVSAEKNKQYCKERYYWLREHNICVRCGKRDAAINMVCCPECLEKQQLRKRDRAHENAVIKARREKKKANGICQRCSRPVCATSKIWCERCRQIANNKRLAAYHKNKNLLPIEERNKIFKVNLIKARAAAEKSPKLQAYRKKIKKSFKLFFIKSSGNYKGG